MFGDSSISLDQLLIALLIRFVIPLALVTTGLILLTKKFLLSGVPAKKMDFNFKIRRIDFYRVVYIYHFSFSQLREL